MLKFARMLTTAVSTLTCLAPGISAQQRAGADEKEIEAYRLTLPALKKYEAVADHLAAWAKTNPEVQAHIRLQASIDSLSKKEELTEAEEARLEKLREQLEKIEASNEPQKMDDDMDIADVVAEITKHKPMVDALQKAGISAREYVVFSFALLEAGMYAAMKQQGMINDIPKDANAANIRFVEQNGPALQAAGAKMDKVSKALAGVTKKGS
jgi:hypothetical protein